MGGVNDKQCPPSDVLVVHLGKYYPPDSGGIEEVTETLAEGTARAGYNVQVECFTPGVTSRGVRNGVEIHRHSAPWVVASQPLSGRYLMAAMRALAKADIVHLHVPNVLAAVAAALTPRKRGTLIVHWHSDILSKGPLGLLAKAFEWLMLRRADAIVATSPPYIDGSSWLRRFRHKVAVIPIGIRDRFPHATLQSSDPGSYLVLAVGRLVPYKGFEVLVEAVPHIDDSARIVIVGEGPLRTTLERRVRELGIGHRVCLPGRLSSDNLEGLYRQASLFCLPSTARTEAFGVVLLEALSARLPIVATQIPHSGVSWVNQNRVTGFNVPVRDVDALANACNALLRDSTLRADCARAARQRYDALFTADESISRVVDLYSNLRHK